MADSMVGGKRSTGRKGRRDRAGAHVEGCGRCVSTAMEHARCEGGGREWGGVWGTGKCVRFWAVVSGQQQLGLRSRAIRYGHICFCVL
eukprot:3852962-Prymnesium_polylepis.1